LQTLVLLSGYSSMDKLELVQVALRELGNVSAQELSSFVARTHGVVIDPKYIPLFKASIRQHQRSTSVRQSARETAEQAKLRALAE
jgi:hypothetical protein